MAKFKTVSKRIEELAHPDVEVRRKAARKLGELGDVRAVQPLCLALRDDDPHLRRAAASALGMLHHPDAMQPLQEALKDKREGLRGAAACAIGQIGKHHSQMASHAVNLILETARKDKKEGRQRYVGALLNMELAAVSPLCVEYSSRRSEVSQQCAELVLSGLQYRSNRDVTRHLLADTSLSPVQVWNVLEMLESHRPTGFFASRRFPTALRLCELVIANPAEADDVQQGAKRVLEYLSLGRGSQRHDPDAATQLLRMASGDLQNTNGDMLLRGSASDSEMRLEKRSLVGRIADTWYDLLGKFKNLFYSN